MSPRFYADQLTLGSGCSVHTKRLGNLSSPAAKCAGTPVACVLSWSSLISSEALCEPCRCSVGTENKLASSVVPFV